MSRSLLPRHARYLTPWDVLDRRMSSLFDQFITSEESPLGEWAGFAPRTNVAETENEYEVSLDLPGIKPEQVNIEFHDSMLKISGQQQEEKEENGKKFHRVERFSGSFQRAISIPDSVDVDKISADYKDGVLTVTLPKSETVKPKQIKVRG